MLSRPTVLILTDWFEPGYQAGGPIRSVANLVKLCQDQIDFSIVTSDRDFQAKAPYPGIEVNKWIESEDFKVMYTSPTLRRKLVKDILTSGTFDKYYFNSFFSKEFTIYPLLELRKLGSVNKVVLAPRGMLGEGALSLKSTKKKIFIALFRFLQLHPRLVFHSTAHSESESIKKVFQNIQLVEIGNIPELPSSRHKHAPNPIRRFVFTSRISAKKNLHYLLGMWKDAHPKSSIIDVYGTKEDENYYRKCYAVVKDDSSASINNALPPPELRVELLKSDFFVLPTLNENFGHSIIEALSAGCPVIISDQTPWNDVEQFGAGWVISLDDDQKWKEVLLMASNLDKDQFEQMSKRAQDYVREKFDFDDLRRKYLKLFNPED